MEAEERKKFPALGTGLDWVRRDPKWRGGESPQMAFGTLGLSHVAPQGENSPRRVPEPRWVTWGYLSGVPQAPWLCCPWQAAAAGSPGVLSVCLGGDQARAGNYPEFLLYSGACLKAW